MQFCNFPKHFVYVGFVYFLYILSTIVFVNIFDVTTSLKQTFINSDDFKIREVTLGDKRCLFAYIDANMDRLLFEQDVFKPLKIANKIHSPYKDYLISTTFYTDEIQQVPVINCPQNIADGDIAFIIDEEEDCYIFSLRKPVSRSIAEPPTASVTKGPREGFIEDIKSNLSLIRRRIKSPCLSVKMFQVGRYSSTSVAVVHIEGICDKHIVELIYDKISKIDIDGIIDSAYILSFIQTRKNSIFTQAGTTEKPDVASAKLLEGRLLIIVDGSPIVITLPYLAFEDVQDGYDYYSADWRASMIRVFRLFGALLTILLPGAYVALQTYHYPLLPLKFLMTLMSATVNIPLPPAFEMLFVLLLFEILNQASIRMPRYFGISLSVVGAIVLGDTAVKAGIISSPSVLVIALSAIGIFCVPDQVGTMSILRLLFLCVASVMGFVGMIILLLFLMGYLASLDNFGTPYLAPYAPRIMPDLQDGLLKAGISSMHNRPYSIPTINRTRMSKNANK